MSYTHKGKVQQNGTIDFSSKRTVSSELAILPEDDGFHIVDPVVGDFEWWYFDLFDEKSGCFLKIVIHIGTDPLRTRVFPQLAVSISTPDRNVSFSQSYHIQDTEIDTHQCNISIKDDIRVWTKPGDQTEHFIKILLPQFQCSLRFLSEIEGWKPLGKEVKFQLGRKSGMFSWTVPVPKASVEGEFIYRGKKYIIHNAVGYHDHNCIKVDRQDPLHLDELMLKWLWGKCYAEKYMMVFMDTYCRTNRILSLLVAENNNIIHSSNNLIDCLISSTNFDSSLKVEYPSSIIVNSKDEDLPFQAAFNFVRLLDSKDLLEGVNPVLKWLIKKVVARPVYHGIFAEVRLSIFDHSWEGFGNYESMVFRNK